MITLRHVGPDVTPRVRSPDRARERASWAMPTGAGRRPSPPACRTPRRGAQVHVRSAGRPGSTTRAAPRRRSRRGPAMSPKRTDDVWVTVPPRATCAAPFCSSASVSHDQPTVGSISSPTCSGSSRACTKQTSRKRALPGVLPGGVVQQDQTARTCRARRGPRPAGRSASASDADGPRVGRQPGRRVERRQHAAPDGAARPTARRPRAGTPPVERSASGTSGGL